MFKYGHWKTHIPKPEYANAFVYMMTFDNGQKYIGCKTMTRADGRDWHGKFKWQEYKSSSKYVKPLITDTTKYEILGWTVRDLAQPLESMILELHDCVNSDEFVNKGNSGIAFNTTGLGLGGYEWTPERRKSQSERKKGVKAILKQCENCHLYIGSSMYTRHHGENCALLRNSKIEIVDASNVKCLVCCKNITRTLGFKAHGVHCKYNSPQPTKKRKRTFDTPNKTCEWCDKTVSNTSYIKHHGDKCVANPNSTKKRYKTCEWCNRTFRNCSYTNHHGDKCAMNPNSTSKPKLPPHIQCGKCGGMFTRRFGLLIHPSKCKGE